MCMKFHAIAISNVIYRRFKVHMNWKSFECSWCREGNVGLIPKCWFVDCNVLLTTRSKFTKWTVALKSSRLVYTSSSATDTCKSHRTIISVYVLCCKNIQNTLGVWMAILTPAYICVILQIRYTHDPIYLPPGWKDVETNASEWPGEQGNVSVGDVGGTHTPYHNSLLDKTLKHSNIILNQKH